MAFSSTTTTLLILLIIHLSTALQVTPNSPCSSFCLDAPDLEKSDPSSSNTNRDEITCKDNDFSSTLRGQKFQRCLSCLQDSAFYQGHETDQQWFLYNLRYSFDSCVFGLPNNTEIESSPCVTSEACGNLENALKNGILEPAHAQPFEFCDVDGGVINTRIVSNCLSCVRAGDSNYYISNFLTAIQAGCEQRPAPGIMMGLSDTVFTTNPINIVAPHTDSKSSMWGASSSLSPSIIVGISIGSFVGVLIIAGCVFMQLRKRKNRRRRAAVANVPPSSFRPGPPPPPHATYNRNINFQTPVFNNDKKEEKEEKEEETITGRRRAHSDALRSNPVKGHTSNHSWSITTSIPSPPPTYSSPRTTTFPQEDFPNQYNPIPCPGDISPYNDKNNYNSNNHPYYNQPWDVKPKSPKSSSPRPDWYEKQSLEQQQQQNTIRISSSVADFMKRTTGKRTSNTSPVSTMSIQTSFPPPPRR